MGVAAIAGLGSGAVHAVAAPDHVLSLAPLAVGRSKGAWRVGLSWGVGHAVGTLAVALVLFAAVAAVDLPGLEIWGERMGGAALVGLGLWGLFRYRRAAAGRPAFGRRGVAVVGLVHGLSGAAALLLLLPAAVNGSPAFQAIFLAGFTIGSTLAMAALTAGIAGLSRNGRCAALLQGRLPMVASLLSVLLGTAWLAGMA